MILFYEIDKILEIDGDSLVGKNLSNLELHRLDLEGLDLENVNFENTHLRSSDFRDSNFTNVNFMNANLCGVAGNNNVYKNANFSNTLSASALFENSNLRNTNFKNSILCRTSFKNSNLTNANFEGADLRNVNFEGADLTNVNFEGADLTNVNFEGAKGLNIPKNLETFSLKQEIEKSLKQNLSELNLERISLNNIEYKLFLEKIVKFILSNNYNELKKLFFDSLIDSQQNIEKYTQNMFDLFFVIKSSDMKYITSQEQKNIFWDYHNQLYKYDSLYVIHAIQMYKENIILFFDTKKSDSVPLALVLNLEGEELFSIPFPTLEDSECVNQNIAFYGGKIDNEKSILEIVFVNGNCWLEFWCRYDLKEKKYIDSGLRK